MPEVYSDGLNFDLDETDYELVERDKVFLRDLNAQIAQGNGTISSSTGGNGQLQTTIRQEPLTEKEFARFIDQMEKIH